MSFYTAAGLINELREAQEMNRLSKLETWLMKQDLIVLDEVGFVPSASAGRRCSLPSSAKSTCAAR